MRSTLRSMVLASLLAVGNISGLGVATARACDHGPRGTYARSASWGYQAESRQPGPAQFGGMPSYDRCAICHPAPPICAPLPPPPCETVSFVVRDSRRVTSSGFSRESYQTSYASPQVAPAYPENYEVPRETPAIYPTPQVVRRDRSRSDFAGPNLPYPTKQSPSVYSTPQDSNPELSLDGFPSDSVPPPPYVTTTPPPLPSPYQPYTGQGPQS